MTDDSSAGRRSPLGLIHAIALFVYGAVPLIHGGMGLLFVPAILVGGVSIGQETTLLRIVGWVVYHLAVTAHGCVMIAAGRSFYRLRWRRGAYTVAFGVVVPGTVIAAFYICCLAFRAAT